MPFIGEVLFWSDFKTHQIPKSKETLAKKIKRLERQLSDEKSLKTRFLILWLIF